MKKLLISAILISGLSLSGMHTISDNDFTTGNSHYEKGEYKKSLAIYQGIAEKTSNWKLFYNIGNSYFKLGDLVKAKINYLKADRLMPFNSSIRHNLDVVEGVLNNNIHFPEPDFLSRSMLKIETMITINVLSVLLVLALVIFSFFLFRLIRSGKSKRRIYGILISSILLLSILGYHSYRVRNFHHNNMAVVVLPDSQLRSGPGAGNTVLFDISPGVTVRIIDISRDWVQVTASPEIAGWLEAENIKKIEIE